MYYMSHEIHVTKNTTCDFARQSFEKGPYNEITYYEMEFWFIEPSFIVYVYPL